MKFLNNLHAVTEFLFFLLGGLLLFAFVLLRNNFFVFEAEIFLRLADIPFAMICILFASTSIRLSLTYDFIRKNPDKEPNMPMLDISLIVIGLVLFTLVLFVNFAFKDLV